MQVQEKQHKNNIGEKNAHEFWKTVTTAWLKSYRDAEERQAEDLQMEGPLLLHRLKYLMIYVALRKYVWAWVWMPTGRSKSEKKKAISKTSSWQKSMAGKYQPASTEN